MGIEHLPGMGVKRENDRLASRDSCPLLEGLNDNEVASVNSIKATDGGYGVMEDSGYCPVVNFHLLFINFSLGAKVV